MSHNHKAAKEKAEIILHTRAQHRAYHEDPNLAACYLELRKLAEAYFEYENSAGLTYVRGALGRHNPHEQALHLALEE